MRRPHHGLTLLEMMFALAIVAMLLTLALPSFGSIVSRHRLKAAAEQLAADLGELRLLAAQRGVPLHLHFEPGAQWCYALATIGGCDCHVQQACQLKTVRAQDHTGVTLLEARNLVFDPGGSGVGGALLQGHEGAQLRVTVTPLGRPKVCAPGGAVAGYASC
jgi:type IV fimbrial biogenesis protein FimT